MTTPNGLRARLVWSQSHGTMLLDGILIGQGYSGHGADKNDPAADGHVGSGPVPRGLWRLTGVRDSANTGPFTITLDAVDAHPGDDRHDATGRGAFRIHGDSRRAPGTASHGCIILDRATRERLWNSGARFLQVVA